jgi:hypothetical protein
MSFQKRIALTTLPLLGALLTGCITGGSDDGDESASIEEPEVDETAHRSTTYLSCDHVGSGMVCNYSGGGSEALWIYDYDNTPWTEGLLYKSANVVSWGGCQDPGSGPYVKLNIKVWSTIWTNFATLDMYCVP